MYLLSIYVDRWGYEDIYWTFVIYSPCNVLSTVTSVPGWYYLTYGQSSYGKHGRALFQTVEEFSFYRLPYFTGTFEKKPFSVMLTHTWVPAWCNQVEERQMEIDYKPSHAHTHTHTHKHLWKFFSKGSRILYSTCLWKSTWMDTGCVHNPLLWFVLCCSICFSPRPCLALHKPIRVWFRAVFLKLFQAKDHLANKKKLADHLTK